MKPIPTWQEEVYMWDHREKAMQQEIDALRTRCAEVEKDAARYRLWRDRYQITFPESINRTPKRVDAATNTTMKDAP